MSSDVLLFLCLMIYLCVLLICYKLTCYHVAGYIFYITTITGSASYFVYNKNRVLFDFIVNLLLFIICMILHKGKNPSPEEKMSSFEIKPSIFPVFHIFYILYFLIVAFSNERYIHAVLGLCIGAHSLFYVSTYHFKHERLLGDFGSMPFCFSGWILTFFFGFREGLYFGMSYILILAHFMTCLLSLDIKVWLQVRIIHLYINSIVSSTPLVSYLLTPDICQENWDVPIACIVFTCLLPIFMYDYLNVYSKKREDEYMKEFYSDLNYIMFDENGAQGSDIEVYLNRSSSERQEICMKLFSIRKGTELDAVNLDEYSIQE